MDVERFKNRLKVYLQYEKDGPPVVGPDRLTFMPYQAFAHLTDPIVGLAIWLGDQHDAIILTRSGRPC